MSSRCSRVVQRDGGPGEGARRGAPFLLSVSHELKTPLTAIRGYAEGLADGAFAVRRPPRRSTRGPAPRTARPRPARSRPHEQVGVQRPPRADRPRRGRARGRAALRDAGAPVRRRSSRPWSASRRRRSATAIAPCRSSPTSSRTPSPDPRRRLRPHRRRAGADRRRGHRGPDCDPTSCRAPSNGSSSTRATARSGRSEPDSGSRS